MKIKNKLIAILILSILPTVSYSQNKSGFGHRGRYMPGVDTKERKMLKRSLMHLADKPSLMT